jgi:hypothetical protein
LYFGERIRALVAAVGQSPLFSVEMILGSHLSLSPAMKSFGKTLFNKR